MNWSGDEIKQLRYRLGYSQAEMARCLKLEFAVLSAVEAGQVVCPVELKSSLLSIFNQAEASSERILRRPIAEAMMRDRRLSQIHDLEVIEAEEEKS